jgi:hypothetical protein
MKRMDRLDEDLQTRTDGSRRIDGAETPLDGIINAIVLKTTNALGESMNAKIQKIKSQACGYRNRQRFRNAIMFHLGGLDLHPQTASTHTKARSVPTLNCLGLPMTMLSYDLVDRRRLRPNKLSKQVDVVSEVERAPCLSLCRGAHCTLISGRHSNDLLQRRHQCLN